MIMTNEQRLEERRKIKSYAPLEKLESIARHHVPALNNLNRCQNGLDTMNNDADDFFEVSVWGLKEALIEAYLLGEKNGHKETLASHKQVIDLAIVGINYSIERLQNRINACEQRLKQTHSIATRAELRDRTIRHEVKITELETLKLDLMCMRERSRA
jgi:hypothetical protein